VKEPRINFDRMVSQIVMDSTLLRWFAFNGHRDEILSAVAIQRLRSGDTEPQVLDFLARHCGGSQ